MVYYSHATTPVIFGGLLVLYYFSIPFALIMWYGKYHAYIKKRNFRLKKLATYLLIAVFVTSFSAYKMTGIYFNLHSPTGGTTCYTSSCVLSAHSLSQYHVNTTELEKLGLPRFGPMEVYMVWDKGTDTETLMPKTMDYVAIVRPLIVVPAARVDVYHVDGKKASWKKSFTIVWPLQPGSVLTEKLKTEFTVIIVTGGRGGGV
jgi:hypothetical protein